MKRRSVDSPPFLIFSAALGVGGLITLLLLAAGQITGILLLAAIALTMRLNTFTIPPRIVVSLVYTVQLAAVLLYGGPMAAWISVGTFLLAAVLRRPPGVPARAFMAVVSFNVGMEALMTLTAGALYHQVAEGSPRSLLTVPGLASFLTTAVALKAVNEILMTIGSALRGTAVREYLAGARRVLPVETAMLPLALLLALVGETGGARGLAVAALVLILASVLVTRRTSISSGASAS
jgi:hypothetical protein